MIGYIAVFLIGMAAGVLCTVLWALCAAQKREEPKQEP